MDINTDTTRAYNARIRIDLEDVDQMQRNSFVAYATSEAERVKQSLKQLMIREYDERHAAPTKEPRKESNGREL